MCKLGLELGSSRFLVVALLRNSSKIALIVVPLLRNGSKSALEPINLSPLAGALLNEVIARMCKLLSNLLLLNYTLYVGKALLLKLADPR